MSKKPVEIWFVSWPDGRVMEGTQTSVDRSYAITSAIRSFLPDTWFPDVDLGSAHHGAGYYLWPSMQKAGFKVQSLEVPNATGVSR